MGSISSGFTVVAWMLTGKVSQKMQFFTQLFASCSNVTYIGYGLLLWNSNTMNVAPIIILGSILGVINGYNLYKVRRSKNEKF